MITVATKNKFKCKRCKKDTQKTFKRAVTLDYTMDDLDNEFLKWRKKKVLCGYCKRFLEETK